MSFLNEPSAVEFASRYGEERREEKKQKEEKKQEDRRTALSLSGGEDKKDSSFSSFLWHRHVIVFSLSFFSPHSRAMYFAFSSATHAKHPRKRE